MSVRAPPSDLRYNDALQVGPEVESCIWIQACELCHHFRTCEFDILGSLCQTVVCVCCVCVSSRGRACARSFHRRFESARAFISQDCEKLKYDIPVHKSFPATCPQEFLPGHISPPGSGHLSACSESPSPPPLSFSHLPACPHLRLTFPSTFYAEWTSCHPASFVHPVFSESISLSFSHLVYCTIFFEVALGIKQVKRS